MAISPLPSGPAPIGATSATTTDGWPALPGARPEGIVDPVLRRGADDGLIFGGLITFGIGYLGGLVMGIADAATLSCYQVGGFGGSVRTPVGCRTGGYALIPFAGPTLSMTLQDGGYRGSDTVSVGLGLGIPLGLAQIVGLWIFLHGIAGYTLDLAEGRVDLGSGASLRFEASSPSSDVGLSAVVEF